jgi:hypothetical protein
VREVASSNLAVPTIFDFFPELEVGEQPFLVVVYILTAALLAVVKEGGRYEV